MQRERSPFNPNEGGKHRETDKTKRNGMRLRVLKTGIRMAIEERGKMEPDEKNRTECRDRERKKGNHFSIWCDRDASFSSLCPHHIHSCEGVHLDNCFSLFPCVCISCVTP